MTATKERKESVRFQLQVADTHERIGGRAVDIASTADLKTRFKLREVQSGNWVLRDVAAAKFHTEQTAGALSDLADIIGAPDGEVSLNGRVALAFGARGTGNAGGSSARAHWEPVQRVINLTKMSGGGTLAHEWFHALDNLVIEMEAARPGKVSDYATENDGLPDGELKQAFTALRSAMMQGDVQARRRFAYTANDVRLAVANVDRSNYGLGLKIKQAGDAEAAIRAVEETFPEKSLSRRGMRKRRDQWLGIAAAHFGRQADGGEVSVKAGPRMSRFAVEAEKLDTMTSKSGRKYWAQPREMAARAFQSYVEDRLSGQGRRNDYLSARADNRWYRLLGPFAPFPEGEERARINQAFDDLFAALRRRGTLRKALRGLRARGTQYKPGLWNVAETTVSTPKWNNPIGRAIGPRRKATLRTTFQDDGNDVKVFGTDPIPEKMRGYGAGVKHYEGMIRRASARGGALVSDHNVSPEAKRVYGALARRGYKVSQDATSGRYRVSKSRTHGPYTIKTKGKRAEAHLDGKRVGWAVVKPNLFRPMSLEGVAVDAEHRRKGLATAMSNALEAKHRRKIKDALPLTREGKAFWANRTVRKDMSPILREAVKKAARSLNAPKNKRQAARRAALYDRVAQNSPNGPAARIAGMEAARNRGVAAGGKYGRGMTEGRAFEEKARASRAYRDDVRSQGRKPRNDKNNDGWVDGQRPTGAKPRKTAASLSVEAITPNARSRSTGEAIGAKASDAKANLMAISRLDGASLRQMAKDNPTTLNWALDAKMTLPQLRRVHQSLTGQRLPETAGLSDHKKAIRAALPGMGSQGRLVVRDTVQATTAKEVASRGAKAKQERKPSNFRIDESVRDPDGLTPNQRSYLDRRKAQAQKEYDAAMASPVGNRFGKPTGEDRYKSDLAELRSKPNKDRNTKWQADTLAMQTQMATSKPEAPWKSQWYRPDRISGVQTGAYSAGGEIRDWDRNAMALGEADAKTGTFAPGNLRGHSRYSYEMAWATARANRKIRKAIRHAIRKMLAPSAYRLAA